MNLKQWLQQILTNIQALRDLIAAMPVPPEVEQIDTAITAATGELKAKLGQ